MVNGSVTGKELSFRPQDNRAESFLGEGEKRLSKKTIQEIAKAVTAAIKGLVANPASGDELLTIPETADLLKVSVKTIYRWIRERKIPSVTVGTRLRRIKKSDAERGVTYFNYRKPVGERGVRSWLK